MDLEKQAPAKSNAILTEAEMRELAHLPVLLLFYLLFQKQFSATPVTALELAAYLGLDVKVSEGLMDYLQQQGIVRAFKDDMPAYSLGRELDQITMKDLIALLGEIHRLMKKSGAKVKPVELSASNEKYRKLYSDLASEILQLFGEQSANQLPI
jgi:Predicted transcriptional regulator